MFFKTRYKSNNINSIRKEKLNKNLYFNNFLKLNIKMETKLHRMRSLRKVDEANRRVLDAVK